MKLEEMFELFREFQQLFLRVSTGVQRILKDDAERNTIEGIILR